MPERQAPWVYDFRIQGTSQTQDRIVKTLNEHGIAARHAFKLMSSQAEYSACRRVGGGMAEAASREVIYLPLTLASAEICARTFELVFDVTAVAHDICCANDERKEDTT